VVKKPHTTFRRIRIEYFFKAWRAFTCFIDEFKEFLILIAPGCQLFHPDPFLFKPIIIRDADKALHLLDQGALSTFCINEPFHRVI
jgi:hypothetical protein